MKEPSSFSNAVFALLLALGPATIRSQDAADSDLSFGSNGVAVAASGESPEGGRVALDRRGRIVVAGSAMVDGHRRISVIRYLPNGMLDPSFGAGGIALLPSPPEATTTTALALAIDGTDNILLAGQSNGGIGGPGGLGVAVVARVLGGPGGAGALDASFGDGGYLGLVSFDQSAMATESIATALAIDGAGRIVVAGSASNPAPFGSGSLDLAIFRLTPSGDLDPDFNEGSPTYVSNSVHADFATGVAVDSLGRILVASNLGAWATVNRLTAEGIPDSGVGPSGRFDVLHSGNMLGDRVWSTGLAVDSADNVVVCGSQSGGAVPGGGKSWVARFPSDSAAPSWVLQEDFGADTESAEALAIQADGRIVAVGFSSGGPGTAVARYLPDGRRDASFNKLSGGFSDSLTGGAGESAFGVAFESRGAIVVAGSNSTAFFAARFGFQALTGPARVRMPATRVGSTSARRAVPISNSGNALATGLRVRALGRARREFRLRQPRNQILLAGAGTVFDVRFRPRAKGMRKARLRLTSGEGSIRMLDLRGRGRPVRPAMSR